MISRGSERERERERERGATMGVASWSGRERERERESGIEQKCSNQCDAAPHSPSSFKKKRKKESE